MVPDSLPVTSLRMGIKHGLTKEIQGHSFWEGTSGKVLLFLKSDSWEETTPLLRLDSILSQWEAILWPWGNLVGGWQWPWWVADLTNPRTTLSQDICHVREKIFLIVKVSESFTLPAVKMNLNWRKSCGDTKGMFWILQGRSWDTKIR